MGGMSDYAAQHGRGGITPPPKHYRDGGAGFKEKGGTSQAAAVKQKKLTGRRAQVLQCFKDTAERRRAHNSPRSGLTADEVAEALGLMARQVRPRLSELVMMGHLEKTTLTRKGDMGLDLKVYRLK